MISFARALIIEKEPAVQSIFKCFLTCNQVRDVSVATSCQQARQMISSADPAFRLIVVDVDTLGPDRGALFTHLKAKRYSGQIVICSTSHNIAVQNVTMIAGEHGLDLSGWVQKPLTKKKLDDLEKSLSRSTADYPTVYSPRAL